MHPDSQTAIAQLRSPQTLRQRCGQLFELASADQLRYFRPDLSRLDAVAEYVLQMTRQSYPDLIIPFHSRWRHFEVGGVPRLQRLEQRLTACTPLERAEAKFDLAIASVLLDAGAGADWRYVEPGTGLMFQRSEGLAIASFHLFWDGVFSSDPDQPLRVDAIALQQLTPERLSQGFQVSPSNPLVGMEGRTQLLQKLGNILEQSPHLFGTHPPRPGNLVSYLLTQTRDGQLPVTTVLAAVLDGLADIWSGRLTLHLDGDRPINLGDTWVHPALLPAGVPAPPPLTLDHLPALIPFHKLSQWLTYSLLEPLQALGLTLTELEALTGLPEYRNGGLCLDLGLVQVKDPTLLQQVHTPGSEVIVEWRSLTVILLDKIAAVLRDNLGFTTDQLPLVKVLQGGTWSAGRAIAAELRPGGISPLQIASDGTLF